MAITMMILLLCAVIALQCFLSRLVSPIPGLILPGIMELYALICGLNVLLEGVGTLGEIALAALVTVLTASAPALALLGLYYALRGKYRRQRQMEKMDIQDLH
ncbi:MAG: hypothetical protein ACI3WR_04590 [Oscillospiraceae bacterium]